MATIPLPTYNGDPIGFANHEALIFQRAAISTTTAIIPGTGFIGLVKSHEDYMAFLQAQQVEPPHGPYVSRQRPELAAAAGEVAITNYKIKMEQFNQQEKDQAIFLATVLASFDPTTTAAIFTELRSTNRAFLSPIRYMEIFKSTHGTMSQADIDKATASLRDPFILSGNIRALIQRHSDVHAALEANNQALNGTTKIKLLSDSLRVIPSFDRRIDLWNSTFPKPIEKVYGNFALAMIDHGENSDLGATVGSLGYSAAVANPTLESLQLQLNEAKAALLALQVTAAKPKPDPKPKPKSHYCWTHGANTSHASAGCNFPKPGHIATATATNKCGGKGA